jgi:hypothetical protein
MTTAMKKNGVKRFRIVWAAGPSGWSEF